MWLFIPYHFCELGRLIVSYIDLVGPNSPCARFGHPGGPVPEACYSVLFFFLVFTWEAVAS